MILAEILVISLKLGEINDYFILHSNERRFKWTVQVILGKNCEARFYISYFKYLEISFQRSKY